MKRRIAVAWFLGVPAGGRPGVILQTAKVLGLSVPKGPLQRADEGIA